MKEKDASVMLKEEISESLLRLKAAKFGRKIEEITPQYDDTFYLPDKAKFTMPASLRSRAIKANPQLLGQSQASSSYTSANTFKQSRTFLTNTLDSPTKVGLGTLYRQTLHDQQLLKQAQNRRSFEATKSSLASLTPHNPTALNQISTRYSQRFNPTTVAAEAPPLQVVPEENPAPIARPVVPTYLRLLSLRQYRRLLTKEKQEEQSGQSTKVKKQVKKSESFTRTEYDECIKQLQGLRALEADLKNRIYEWVEVPQAVYAQEQLALRRYYTSISVASEPPDNSFVAVPTESPLRKDQEKLLSMLIYFDALMLDSAADPIKKRLYDLFFQWRTSNAPNSASQETKETETDSESKQTQAAITSLDKAERKKRIQLKKDLQLQEF